jgi:hypothetical protein
MLAITTLFLAVIFIAAELYRFRKRITGLIREIHPLDGDPTGLMGARLRVLTPDAGEVTAFASGCQLCATRIQAGEKVTLVPGPNGYVMTSHWNASCRPAEKPAPHIGHGACPKEVAP